MSEIKHLEANGFLASRDVDIKLDGLSFITGENNVGKSTIKNALEWGITGETRMTKGSKIAEKFLVSDDPEIDKCRVSLKVGDLRIIRERTKKSSSTLTLKKNGEHFPQGPKSYSKTEKQEFIYDELGINEDLAHFLLDGYDYASISASDRREKLFTIFGVDDNDKIIHHLNNSNLPDEYVENVKGVLSDIEGGLDDLIDHYTTLRREKKRDRRDAKREKEDAEMVEVVEVVKNGEAQELPYEKAIHKRDEDYYDYLDELRDELEQIDYHGGYDGPDKDELEDRINSVRLQLDDLPDADKLDESIQQLKAEQINLNNKIDAAENEGGRCIYDDSCECPVDDTVVESFVDEASDKLDEIDGKIWNRKKALKKVKKLTRKQDKLEQKLDQAPDSDKKAQFDKVKSKIDDLETTIERIDTAEEKNEAYKQAESKLNSTNSSIDRCKAIISTLEDIKSTIISEALSNYRDTLAAISNIFEEKFEINDDLELLLKGRPAYALSDSEHLRLAYANQIALALVTGANFFVLDDVDTLFGENRHRLLKVLKGLRDRIGSGIAIFSSNAKDTILEDSRLVRVVDGTAETIAS